MVVLCTHRLDCTQTRRVVISCNTDAVGIVSKAASAAPALPTHRLLAGVRVVLCAPSGPRNIGGALRSAANFEADEVYVVRPRCNPWERDVLAAACCDPDQLQQRLRVVPDLAAALDGAVSSVGFTRRAGAGRVTHPSLRRLLAQFPEAVPSLLIDPSAPPLLAETEAGQESLQHGSSSSVGAAARSTSAAAAQIEQQATSLPVAALVFGREESGLLESELALCSHACAIPTGDALGQPSMNLSHAVAVVLAQMYETKWERSTLGGDARSNSTSSGVGDRLDYLRQVSLQAAPLPEVEALLERVAAVLEAAGMEAEDSRGGGDRSAHGRRRLPFGQLRRLLLRSQASTAEVRALHGVCKQLMAALTEAQRR